MKNKVKPLAFDYFNGLNELPDNLAAMLHTVRLVMDQSGKSTYWKNLLSFENRLVEAILKQDNITDIVIKSKYAELVCGLLYNLVADVLNQESCLESSSSDLFVEWLNNRENLNLFLNHEYGESFVAYLCIYKATSYTPDFDSVEEKDRTMSLVELISHQAVDREENNITKAVVTALYGRAAWELYGDVIIDIGRADRADKFWDLKLPLAKNGPIPDLGQAHECLPPDLI